MTKPTDMCRLTDEFFSFLKAEIGNLRFAVNQTVVNATLLSLIRLN